MSRPKPMSRKLNPKGRPYTNGGKVQKILVINHF